MTESGELGRQVIAVAAFRLANARGESVDDVFQRFGPTELIRCPPRFSKHLKAVRQAKFTATGVRDGLAYVRLGSGQVFYSPLTHASLKREYSYIRDTLPDCITEDTYLAAIDVVQRYLTDYAWPPEGLVPANGANIIELGAYLGHKTIRFAEELAAGGGRVLAVEMIPENCEILRKNVAENGFADVVDILPVGVWKEPGRVTVYSKGRQRNSILPIRNLEDGEKLEAEVRALDQVIDGWSVRSVDLVFVTVNGAEVEVLEGFHPEGRDVRAFFVAAPYARDGQDNAEVCRRLLREHGYSMVDTGSRHRIVGKRPGVRSLPRSLEESS